MWLSAAAAGPKPYAAVQGVIGSSLGQIVLFGCSFAFFLHLCGGIRHLVWDTVHGFTLPLDLHLGMGGRSDERSAHRGGLGRQFVCRWALMNRQSFRLPLARAVGLGSAKKGSQHWWADV